MTKFEENRDDRKGGLVNGFEAVEADYDWWLTKWKG